MSPMTAAGELGAAALDAPLQGSFTNDTLKGEC